MYIYFHINNNGIYIYIFIYVFIHVYVYICAWELASVVYHGLPWSPVVSRGLPWSAYLTKGGEAPSGGCTRLSPGMVQLTPNRRRGWWMRPPTANTSPFG